MGRRSRRWDPPLSGPCPNLGPQVTESRSQDELAGQPPPAPVELRPISPPLQITEAGPLRDQPPTPSFNRGAVLAGIRAAFTHLSDSELEVARRRMLGVSYSSISEELGMLTSEVERTWKQARQKLGMTMFRRRVVTQLTNPDSPPPSTETPQGTGDTSPA